MTSVEQLPIPCLKLGEGPYWLAERGALLLVDVFDKALRIYDVTARTTKTLFLDNKEAPRASMAIPIEGEDDLYIIGLGRTLSVVRWKEAGADARPVKPFILHQTEDHHFNDAKCDSQGRLWVGTMTYLNEKEMPGGHQDSALYKYDHDLTITKMADKFTISNGMAWSVDRKTLYFVDSTPALIYAFDYDEHLGETANQRVVFDFEAAGLANQSPDGMTIDTDGNLWVACFGGAQVIQVDPRTRQLLRQVPVPSLQVTSVCFGGPRLDTLFVTSGTLRLGAADLHKYPQAGGTFAITGLGAKGYLPVNFKPDLQKLRSLLKE